MARMVKGMRLIVTFKRIFVCQVEMQMGCEDEVLMIILFGASEGVKRSRKTSFFGERFTFQYEGITSFRNVGNH